MGTNKRYPQKERAWDPPWPPIQISDCEWIIIRNYADSPAALIRRFDAGPDHPGYFRAVTWAPSSSSRRLIGRYPTLKDADRAVPFVDESGASTSEPPALMWTQRRRLYPDRSRSEKTS